MSPAEYKAAVAALGVTMTAFAEWAGAHGQTGRRWAAAGPPGPVAKLLRLMVALRLGPADVDQKITGK